MASFKFVISQANKSYQVEKEQEKCPLIGKKLDETFSGDFLGLEGYELRITGGSDRDGFPMRKDIESSGRKRFIVKKGVGYSGIKKIKKKKFRIDGIRKMKSIRGNTISAEITQINCKVSKAGLKPLEEILGKVTPEKESKEETPAKQPNEKNTDKEIKETSNQKQESKETVEKK
jgi:small subunit ribosomal protein S6e